MYYFFFRNNKFELTFLYDQDDQVHQSSMAFYFSYLKRFPEQISNINDLEALMKINDIKFGFILIQKCKKVCIILSLMILKPEQFLILIHF
jgi:hypothetical protein